MQAEKEPLLSVIIPCYNEEKNLANKGVLAEVYDYLAAQALPWEVIIVNDESTDDSRALVERFIADRQNFSLFDIPHGGKPAAIWEGIQRARGEMVLLTDMDQSTPIHHPRAGQAPALVSRGLRGGHRFAPDGP